MSVWKMGLVEESEKVLEWCENHADATLLAYHTFPIAYFMLRKGYKERIFKAKGVDESDQAAVDKARQQASLEADRDAKVFLKQLASWTEVAPTSHAQVVEGLNRTGDVEDNLQCLCAKAGSADLLVTKDKIRCEVATITPGEFIEKFVKPSEIRRLVDLALQHRVVKQKGNWYRFEPENLKIQGRTKLEARLLGDDALTERVQAAVDTAMNPGSNAG